FIPFFPPPWNWVSAVPATSIRMRTPTSGKIRERMSRSPGLCTERNSSQCNPGERERSRPKRGNVRRQSEPALWLRLLVRQGVQQGLAPGPGRRVVGAEPGSELPVRPADAVLLRLPGHGARPAGPRLQVCGRIRPELAQVQRPPLLLRPRRRLREVLPQ